MIAAKCTCGKNAYFCTGDECGATPPPFEFMKFPGEKGSDISQPTDEEEVNKIAQQLNDIKYPTPPAAVEEGKDDLTVEICWTDPDGKVYVNYRREANSTGAKSLMAMVDEEKEKHGENCKYFYRFVN